MLETLVMLFSAATETYNLPPGLLRALCFVESSHRVSIIHHHDGNGDSVGICQIKLATANVLGFRGTQKELMEPKNNIYYAGAYLQKQLMRYDNDLNKAVAAYNSGTYYERDGKPVNLKYVQKVFKAWDENR